MLETSFGDLLRKHRRDAGLTQEELAERSGVSREAVSALERGIRRHPHRETVTLLVSALSLKAEHAQALVAAARRRSGPASSSAAARGKAGGSETLASSSSGTESRPAQLPRRQWRLLGREDELAALDAALRSTPARPMVVTGPPGIGKTSLTVAWAHDVAGQFPDGQLFLNLLGADTTTALSPMAALAALLSSLGVPAHEVPAAPHLAADMYRSMSAGKRLLVILDNAAGFEQVELLIPTSSSSATVITSRHHMPSAVMLLGAGHVQLGPLSKAASVQVLASFARDDGSDSSSLHALADVCGRYPLALSIAATNLDVQEGRGVTALTGRLIKEGLAALTIGPEAPLETVFRQATTSLTAGTGRALHQMASLPCRTLDAPALAAAMGTSEQGADAALRRLARNNLVLPTHNGRYEMHDLIRELARLRSADGTSTSSDAATLSLQRLADYYTTQARWATAKGHPGRTYPPDSLLPDLPAIEHTDAAAAREWLDTERENLCAVLARLHEVRDHRRAWLLALTLLAGDWTRANAHLWREVRRLAFASARADHCSSAVILASTHESVALTFAGRHDEAVQVLSAAADLPNDASWDDLEFSLRFMFSWVYRQKGDLSAALLQAELARAAKGPYYPGISATLCLINLGLGRFEEAVATGLDALSQTGSPLERAQSHVNIADAYLRLGLVTEAEDHVTSGERLLSGMNDPYRMGGVLDLRARALLARGRASEALSVIDESLTHMRQVLRLDAEARSLATRAVVQLALRRHHEALSDATRAVDLLSAGASAADLPRALLTLARAEHAVGNPQRAVAAAEEGVRTALASGYVGDLAALEDIAAIAGSLAHPPVG